MFENVKAIFIDSEGTLINTNNFIKSETIKLIDSLTEKGIYVIITSGLPRFIIRNKQIKSHASNYIIASNGADIFDLEKNKSVFAYYLDQRFVYEIWRDYKDRFNIILGVGDDEYASSINIYNNNPIIINSENINNNFYQCHISQKPISLTDNIEYELSILKKDNYHNLKDYIDSNLLNRFFKYSNNLKKNEIEILIRLKRFFELQKIQEEIIKKYFNLISIANQSADFTKFCTMGEIPWFTINNSDVSKGNGIVKISNFLGIPKKQRIAIGNDYNDRTMIGAVKTFLCPSNSSKMILEKCSYIYDEKDGIDKVLRKVLVDNE